VQCRSDPLTGGYVTEVVVGLTRAATAFIAVITLAAAVTGALAGLFS
jgi:hypothetical protein